MDPKAPAGDAPETVVADPLRFKVKLAIGDKAYRALRAREHLTTFAEAVGLGTAASAVASSSLIAKTFFTGSTLVGSALSAIGVGAAAVTPIGWVIGAGLVAGGVYAGVSRLLEREKDTGLTVIPDYVETPLDLVGLSLAELMVPISLKIATADGELSDVKLAVIRRYYVDEWGFDAAFFERVVANTLPDLEQVTYARFTDSLAVYTSRSKACFKPKIFEDLLSHLREVVEADGRITEAEKRELDYLTSLLVAQAKAAGFGDGVAGLLTAAVDGVTETARVSGRGLRDLVVNSGRWVGRRLRKR